LIDNSILYANRIPLDETQKRYGWVCESSAIVPQLVSALEDFKDVIFEDGKFSKIFTCNQKLLELDDRFEYCPAGSNLPWVPEESWKIHSKNKMCSMIASAKNGCPGHQYRQEVACKFKKKLDLFGGACGSERIGISKNIFEKWNDKRDGLCDYRFSVVMENESVPNYYTEKITDCFATGTIPIYWGATNINEIFDEKGIITLSDDFDPLKLSEDLYMEMLPHAEENLKRVKELELADDYLVKRIK